ncbi:hypothetical protein EUGRSUZ_L03639 [Eucalyptus grandis]|uniref:Uncharacterized protein n=1 Tax=Eucalyptus grandis TaxID=71139 RepID=A0AAD9T849_EUCGR|nr:hypothetical protein EUGRSUZ_L03639 [Eucalyptus grandis]
MRFIVKIQIDHLCNCLLCGHLPFHSVSDIYVCMMKWLYWLDFDHLETEVPSIGGTLVFIASLTEYDDPVKKHAF